MTAWNFMVHPAAERYPLMDAADLEDLACDIGENGQREPIWLDVDGYLIDGRNRQKACQLAGVEPTFATYHGEDIEAFIESKNEHRRHLTHAQLVELRRAKVARLREEGMSTRAIAEDVGVSEGTVRLDLQVRNDYAPAPAAEPQKIIGKDGKSYDARQKTAALRRSKSVALYEQGVSVTTIAEMLGVGPNVISKDLSVAGIERVRSKANVERRWRDVAELATTSMSAVEIARRVGLSSVEVLRAQCKERGIVIASDAVIGNKRRVDSNRIVAGIVDRVDTPATSFELIDYSALDPDQLSQWASSLTDSIRSLTTLRNNLRKELARVQS